MSTVDVIIPIFDAAYEGCQRVIDSAVMQTYKTNIVIVLPENMEYLFHIPKEVKILRSKYKGIETVVEMANEGLRQTSSEYVTFIAPSMFLHPNKIEYQMQLIGQYDISNTDCLDIRKRLDKIVSVNSSGRNKVEEISLKNVIDVVKKNFDTLSINYPISTGMLYKRSLFNIAGLFNIEFPLFFEFEFLKRVSSYAKYQHIGNPLFSEISDEASYDGYFGVEEFKQRVLEERKKL